MKFSMIVGLMLIVILGASSVHATVRADPCDAARCAVQATLGSACPCNGTGHGSWYKCMVKQIKQLSAQGKLPAKCVRKLLRCASGSTCGRGGYVVCNIPIVGCRSLNSVSSCTFAGGTPNPGAVSCCTSCSALP